MSIYKYIYDVTTMSLQATLQGRHIVCICLRVCACVCVPYVRVPPNHPMYHYRCHFNAFPDKMGVCAPYVRVPPNHRMSFFYEFNDVKRKCSQLRLAAKPPGLDITTMSLVATLQGVHAQRTVGEEGG